MKHTAIYTVGLMSLILAAVINILFTESHEPIKTVIVTILISVAAWTYYNLMMDYMDTEAENINISQENMDMQQENRYLNALIALDESDELPDMFIIESDTEVDE